jgi:hypothetical protein
MLLDRASHWPCTKRLMESSAQQVLNITVGDHHVVPERAEPGLLVRSHGLAESTLRFK